AEDGICSGTPGPIRGTAPQLDQGDRLSDRGITGTVHLRDHWDRLGDRTDQGDCPAARSAARSGDRLTASLPRQVFS
ncbi:MAG TPA: hypothetical protein DCG84_00735, partial [Peptococcaceae bacterium]|nr:hypothetical protein [Peptococcaceae bacterium]